MSEKASKGRFLYDKPERLQKHSNEEIGKEKEKSQGKERRRREKSNGRTLSFYTSSFGRGAASFSTIVVGLR